MMTVGELKNIVENISDDTVLGGVGFFGEYLEVISVSPCEVYRSITDTEKIKILEILIESAGDEPD